MQNPTCTESGKVLVNYRLITFPSGSIQQVFQLDGQKTNLPRYESSSYDCGFRMRADYFKRPYTAPLTMLKSLLPKPSPVYGYISKTMTHNSNKKAG